MKKVPIITFGLCLLLLFVGVGAVSAQTGNAQLGGIVQDPTHALIPGVTVTATNVDTNVTQTTLTNEAGAYNFPVLQPGTYRVSAELQGFKKVDRGAVEWRRKNRNAEFATLGEKSFMPIPWRVRLLVQLIKAAAVPEPALDLEVRPRMVDGHGVRRVSLQLDGVGTRGRCCLDQFKRAF